MRLSVHIIFLSLAAILSATSAEIRVINEGAITYMRFLSKADFDLRYPGTMVASPAELATGWYVIYEHQSLNYYFGPILLESTGQDYYDQLKDTVDAAVAQRPTIEGYRLELSYEPQVTSNGQSSLPPESNQGSETGVGTPQPASKPSIFDFFRKLFGF